MGGTIREPRARREHRHSDTKHIALPQLLHVHRPGRRNLLRPSFTESNIIVMDANNTPLDANVSNEASNIRKMLRT